MRGAVLQALPTLALVSLLAVVLLLLAPVLNRRAAAGVRCLIWGALLLRLLLPFSRYAPIQVDVEVPAGSRLLLATGVAAAPLLKAMVDEARKKWHNLQIEVVPIINYFFGETINVAGLVTGGDLIRQLAGKAADILLIPDVMLRHEQDRFLDDVTPEEVENALGIRLEAVAVDGDSLVDALLL